jgi:hypothetical protein
MMRMVGRIDNNTRNFSKDVVDLVRGETSQGRQQAQTMVTYLMNSKGKPDGFAKESTLTYWVTSKPGAGKSTLIKFILTDSRMKSCLRQWARNIPLLSASFYSWNTGNGLQKSHEGLLRTLLHQCVQQRLELVPAHLRSVGLY